MYITGTIQASNGEPFFSWISGGRSMSAMSTCTISLAMSSTENGMLHQEINGDFSERMRKADSSIPNRASEANRKEGGG